MIKVTALKDCSIYDEFFDDYKIEIQKYKLYYAYPINDKEYYYIYHYESADYIGLYPADYFGPYELFVSLERDRKIDEILND